jgi:beta-lactamase regulating signal transducer with metallopeptidase domain
MTTLASTLVHFVWQGTLVALAAAVFLRFGPRAAPVRYGAGVVTLAVMALTPVVTFVALSRVDSPPATAAQTSRGTPPAAAPVAFAAVGDGEATLTATPAPSTAFGPLVVLAWASGVLLLSVRLVGGWLVARRLASRVAGPVGPGVTAVVARVSRRLGVRQRVRVFQSATCAVPVVIGWLRPVVLLPVAALAGLPPAQIESLLAHELAHVRRHDYLVNLLQAMLETVLFYHPGVWWVSRQVRIEREHCCDDLAVSVCDRVEYASALSALATITATPQVALAATDGPLLSRVRRLLGPSAGARSTASLWCGAVTAVAVVMLIPMATKAVAFRPALTEPLVTAALDAPPVRSVESLAAPTADVDRVPEQRGQGQVPPSTVVPTQAAAPQQVAGTEPFLRQQLQDMERRLQELHGERQAAEDARLAEVFQAREATLMATLERLRIAHEEVKTRFEIGRANADEAADFQAMIGMVEEELSGLRREERAREATTQIARTEATLQSQYANLQAQYAALREQRLQAEAGALGNQAARLQGRGSVIAVSHGLQRAFFEPRLQPYTQGGPSLYFTVPEGEDARTSDGSRISRVRFIGWREGDATRVMVLVSVPGGGEANAYTTDTSRLVERDAGTYLIRFGELLELKDLEAFGIRNVSISSVVPVQ